MMLRQSLLLAAATVAFAGAGQAQTRGQSRDDLLDALTRHIQICGEITDTQQRLSCYDRLQTQVGGVSAPTAAPRRRHCRPLRAPPTADVAAADHGIDDQQRAAHAAAARRPGRRRRHPGRPRRRPCAAPPATQDPNAAFDPRTATYRPPEALGPKPQPQMRRTGPRPIPYSSTPQPLVTLGATNLTYGDSRYWQVTVTLTSNTPKRASTPRRSAPS